MTSQVVSCSFRYSSITKNLFFRLSAIVGTMSLRLLQIPSDFPNLYTSSKFDLSELPLTLHIVSNPERVKSAKRTRATRAQKKAKPL